MACRCHECRSRYKIDIIVPDDMWEKIKPDGAKKKKGGGMLCPVCIAHKIHTVVQSEVGYGAFRLEYL